MSKPAAGFLVLALAFIPAFGYAQEGSEKKEPAHVHEEGKQEAPKEDGMELWKWANFLLLAGLIGYGIGKNAGPFFDGRTRQIQKDMTEAAEARSAAEARAAEAERRLANLETEIAAMREGLRQEAVAEEQRLSRQTTEEIAKIQTHAEWEIVSAGKLARSELKRYSAELALGLAEQKIRARMTPDAEDAMVRNFVHDLK